MELLWARLAWDGGPGEVWGNQVWRVALWPPRQTQQRTVALQSPPFLRLAPLPPFSPRPPFSDVKIYKGAHRVHFATCIHKQSVSFLSQKHGVPSEREKTFLADIMYTNAHRRPPVPAKNRCYGGHFSFFFLSLIWKHVYCTWEKNAPSKLDRLLRARESCAGPAWQTLARPVSHSCFYLSKIINRPGEKPRLWLFQHNAVKFKCERLSGWISGVLCLLMEGRSWGILVWILHVREPQTLKLPWRCERVCWPCDSLNPFPDAWRSSCSELGCRKRVKGQINLFVTHLRAKSHFHEDKKSKMLPLWWTETCLDAADHTSSRGLLFFGWKVSLFCCPVSPRLKLLWDQKPDTKQEFPGCFFLVQDTYTSWELVWTHASLQGVYTCAEVCADCMKSMVMWYGGCWSLRRHTRKCQLGSIDERERLHYTFPISPLTSSPSFFSSLSSHPRPHVSPVLHLSSSSSAPFSPCSYLSSIRTHRSLKCRCRCFFCLFLLFFFSILLSAFSSSSRLSGGRSMWGNRSSSRGRPWSSSLWGSSWRKGSRTGDSSWCPSDSGEAGLLQRVNITDKILLNITFTGTRAAVSLSH